MPDASGVIQIFILILLILLSAFFSSAETAFSTVNHVRMTTLEEEGNKKAAKVNLILENHSKVINMILICNNTVNITAAAIAAVMAIRSHFSAGIAVGVLTLVILLISEIVPKTWAKLYNEKLSLAYSSVIYTLTRLLTPIVAIIVFLSNIVLRLFGIDPKQKAAMTEDELKTYVDASHEDGVIETEEREIIYNVFDFSDAVAKDIMIPRINMVTLDVEDTYDTVMNVFRESMYTRLPVYQESTENIIGFVNIKDFILVTDQENFSVKSILRPAHYTYEFKNSSDLMLEMREKATTLAFVLNEYGATVGMITMEDLLEEIVGEIRDEYDQDEEENIVETGERTYMVKGNMKLDDINDALDTELESEDYDSLGGIIIEKLDRLPEEGEEVTLEDGTVLKVTDIEQNRIMNVQMILPESEEDEDAVTDDKNEEA